MSYLKAAWAVPNNVHAYSTLRQEGFSQAPFDEFNLGDHVGDLATHVEQNRNKLEADLDLKVKPSWLKQVHGTNVIKANADKLPAEADASYSFDSNQICIVMTADCLPVVFYNRDNSAIAAAHAGWKGLAAGVLIKTIQALGDGNIQAYLGPAIGPLHFEVGLEVFSAFTNLDSENERCFTRSDSKQDKWFANLYELARLQLAKHGVNDVSGGDYCTFKNKELFYSYRRERNTGRMATLIWKS